MGGFGSGGHANSGQKPAAPSTQWLRGTRGAGKPGQPPPIDGFDPPDDLSPPELSVWDRLSPHAFAARTLTRTTEYQFTVLWRSIVLERELAINADKRGGADHRARLQRVDAELARFALAPNGKPIIPDVPDGIRLTSLRTDSGPPETGETDARRGRSRARRHPMAKTGRAVAQARQPRRISELAWRPRSASPRTGAGGTTRTTTRQPLPQ